MNKNRMILAAIGGVIGLAVLVMAYFTWSAYAAKTAAIEGDEESEGLDTVVSKAQTLSHKPVYPCAESVKKTEEKAEQFADWKAEAAKLVSRGDKVFEKTTPAAFKTFIVSDAKRLAALPGAVNGALVKPAFDFGPFKDYIAEGKMPAEDKLAVLQRQWDDVAIIVEALSGCGIAELTGIELKERKVEEAVQPQKGKNQKANKARKPARKDAPEEKEPAAHTYAFTFTTRAPGFVKSINTLSTAERFIVVDDFTFTRAQDAIAEVLGGDEKKAAQQASGRRNRRNRRAAAEVAPEEANDSAKKNGIVTDPVLDAPFTAVLTVTVYDFRSLEEEPAATDKKGSAK